MPTVYIGVGSNILPGENIPKALEALSRKADITGISTFYQTAPVDRPGQPLFYNGVVRIETDAGARDLKYKVLREIEKQLGRHREADKSASRTIDLDILLYGQSVVHEDDLVIPDPDIAVRPFLAMPLHELDGNLRLPGSGIFLSAIVRGFKETDMEPLLEFTNKLRRIKSDGHEKSGTAHQGTSD